MMFKTNTDTNTVTLLWNLWLTLIEVSYVVLFQQRTNELQLRVDVLVDVRGPLVTLMESAEEMHSRLQQHRHPGAAERFTREQITGHASHLQVTECHLWWKQRYGFITLKKYCSFLCETLQEPSRPVQCKWLWGVCGTSWELFMQSTAICISFEAENHYQ